MDIGERGVVDGTDGSELTGNGDGNGSGNDENGKNKCFGGDGDEHGDAEYVQR